MSSLFWQKAWDGTEDSVTNSIGTTVSNCSVYVTSIISCVKRDAHAHATLFSTLLKSRPGIHPVTISYILLRKRIKFIYRFRWTIFARCWIAFGESVSAVLNGMRTTLQLSVWKCFLKLLWLSKKDCILLLIYDNKYTHVVRKWTGILYLSDLEI